MFKTKFLERVKRVFHEMNLDLWLSMFDSCCSQIHINCLCFKSASEICSVMYMSFFHFPDNPVEGSRPVSSFSAQPWHSCHKLIYVRPNPKTGVPVGHWPIPESFWPDQNAPSLVSGDAEIPAAPSVGRAAGRLIESWWTQASYFSLTWSL